MKYLFYIISGLLIATVLFGCMRGDNVSVSKQSLETNLKADSCLIGGKYAEAVDLYVKAIVLADKSHNDTVKGASMANLGTIFAYFEDYNRAHHYYKNALDIAEATNDSIVARSVTINLIMTSIWMNDTAALKKWRKYKNDNFHNKKPFDIFWEVYIDAYMQLESGNHAYSRTLFKDAYKICRDNNLGLDTKLMVLTALGKTWLKEERLDSALRYFEYVLNDTSKYMEYKKDIITNLVNVYSLQNNVDSLTKYQTVLLNMYDSVYNSIHFNYAKYNLQKYEEDRVNLELQVSRQRQLYLLLIALVILAALVAVITLYRKLLKAWGVLYLKNRLLIHESEERRSQRRKMYLLEGGGESSLEDIGCDDFQSGETACDSQSEVDNGDQADTGSDVNQGNPKLREETCNQLNKQICQLFDDEKVYLNPDLTINGVAASLNTNSKYIAWTIQKIHGMSFRSFLNQRRLEEVCRRLDNDAEFGKFTIAAIGADCGFKSNSNFMSLFKSYTGLTPLKYRTLSRQRKE